MDLQQIVAFAISREIEAAEFYRNMSRTIKSASGIALLQDLELMEREHIKLLTDFNRRTITHYKPIDIPDLKISDAMEIPEESVDMSFQEVLVIAMKREEISNKLYAILADEAEDEFMRKLFRKLSEEEARHKFDLESLYDKEILREN